MKDRKSRKSLDEMLEMIKPFKKKRAWILPKFSRWQLPQNPWILRKDLKRRGEKR
jgi:hypothetical protein